MASSVRPTFQARTCTFDRVPARGHCQGRRSQGTCLKEAASRLGSEKANPSEPIEVKPLPFRQMLQILRKRTHKSYQPCFQSVTAKTGLIGGNSAPSRTRIEATNSAGGRNVLRPFPPVFGSWEGAKASMPQDDPGMSFKIRGEGGGGAPAHQDLGNPSGSFEGSWQVGRSVGESFGVGWRGSDFSAADGRLGPDIQQQNRNLPWFHGDRRRGLCQARGLAPAGGVEPTVVWNL